MFRCGRETPAHLSRTNLSATIWRCRTTEVLRCPWGRRYSASPRLDAGRGGYRTENRFCRSTWSAFLWVISVTCLTSVRADTWTVSETCRSWRRATVSCCRAPRASRTCSSRRLPNRPESTWTKPASAAQSGSMHRTIRGRSVAHFPSWTRKKTRTRVHTRRRQASAGVLLAEAWAPDGIRPKPTQRKHSRTKRTQRSRSVWIWDPLYWTLCCKWWIKSINRELETRAVK